MTHQVAQGPWIGGRLAFVVALFAFALARPAAHAQAPELVRYGLEQHGVATSPEGLLRFLAGGWQGAEPPATLPQAPAQKSTLLVDAWRLLSEQQRTVKETPALRKAAEALARRYATGDLPGPVLDLVAADPPAPPGSTVSSYDQALDYLRYNGMIALGLFGEPSDETLAVAREVYETESRPVIKVSHARTLGLLGDESVVPYLVKEAAKGTIDSSPLAARVLETLYGVNFRLRARQAIGPRHEAAREIAEWYANLEDAPPEIRRDAAMRRYLRPEPVVPYPRRTLREKLRAAADKTDIADRLGARTAWYELQAMGEGLVDRLEPIVEDEREDLDIRSEAIRWYARLRRKKARGTLKDLRDDPNEPIAELARRLLARIDSD